MISRCLQGPLDYPKRQIGWWKFLTKLLLLFTQIKECAAEELGKGYLVSCLVEHRGNITDYQCNQYITKMTTIIFSDYRLVCGFVGKCRDDINALHCGSISTGEKVPDRRLNKCFYHLYTHILLCPQHASLMVKDSNTVLRPKHSQDISNSPHAFISGVQEHKSPSVKQPTEKMCVGPNTGSVFKEPPSQGHELTSETKLRQEEPVSDL